MSRRTHYNVLNVPPVADHERIRRAYHTEARRWHPDRVSKLSASDAAKADDAMREVNEAWRVLRDTARRKAYDQSLNGGASESPLREGIRVDANNVTRIDPRLLDPEFIEARRKASSDYIDNRRSMFFRVLPWLAFGGLIVGIFVFTAYQGDNRPASNPPTTLAGPDVGVPANACVRIIGGPQLLEIPCTGFYDGRVIGAYEDGGACPDPQLTIREVALSNDIVACLGE